MKKLIIALMCMALSFSMAACTTKDKPDQTSSTEASGASNEKTVGEPSSTSDISQEPESLIDSSEDGGEAQQPQTQKYAQSDGEEDLGNAKAYLTLNPDGSFVIEMQAYDGMPKITGTYTLSGDTYQLMALETNAQSVQLSDLQSIVFVKHGDSLTYQGDAFGETVSGSEFVPYQ